MVPILYNPIAGNGYCLQVLQRVKETLDSKAIPYLLRGTEAPGHATTLARELIEQGFPRFFTLGGDGTLFETVQAMRGTQTALGILPGGTGNDFIKCTSLPRDPVEALLYQLDRPAVPCDLAAFNDRCYLNVAGTGFDVETLKNAEKYKKNFRGILPYLCGVAVTLFRYTPISLEIEIDGTDYSGAYTIVSIGNGQYFGGGMHPTPLADPADGKLDVMLARAMPASHMIRLLPSFIKGTHIRFKKDVRYLNARKIHIRGENLTFNMDGNLFDISDAVIEILPGQILLLL